MTAAWLLAAACAALPQDAPSADLSRGDLRVSPNRRFLVHADGSPFFYLGDTAWELFHRLTREEAERYLEDRRRKRFTVVQAVALAELDGLKTPNPYGHRPLVDLDPTRPDVREGPDNDYWDHVDDILERARRKGLFIGLLPTWGDKVTRAWGVGPVVFNPDNARAYGRWLGERYKDRPNLIWILGGDRNPDGALEVWRALARGLREGDGGRHLITYHPQGGHTSAAWFHADDWLDFNMLQSGHNYHVPNYAKIEADYRRTPPKPCMDGEPRYEDHPAGFKKENGYMGAYDVRQAAYWALFAGAHGHTYGAHPIWQMYAPGRAPISHARTFWTEALDLPGAGQMRHVRALLESRPFLSRAPDQSLLAQDAGRGPDHMRATRGEGYGFIYIPTGKPVTVALGKISGAEIRAGWFDPRTGTWRAAETVPNSGTRTFHPPPPPDPTRTGCSSSTTPRGTSLPRDRRSRIAPRVRRVPLPVLAALGTAACTPPPAEPERVRPFVLHVVDEETGRGVPLVELRTTNDLVFHTDNAGVVAFDEPGLLGERVFFHVESPGYEFPADGFGYRGAAVETAPGGRTVLKVRRVQIAERLYRITGQGLYHHAARAGLPAPLRRPQLNARVMGQDSTLAVVHRGKIRWFWGDTNRPGYPLGHFGTATATSRLPEDGGLPPSVGIDLEYAADESGFSRATFTSREPTPIWIEGVFILTDPEGRERLLACYRRMKDLATCVEQGIAVFEDDAERFRTLVVLPLDEDRRPTGQAFRVREGEQDFIYFATPYPTLRVRARWEDVLDPARYEAFTPLREGTRYDPARPALDRDVSGTLLWAWKRGTSPVDRDRQEAWVRAGALAAEEARFRTADAASGEPLRLHRGSVRRNAFRNRWVMIANRIGAPGSMLGDVYYAESSRPEGPWTKAVRVAVHGRYSFYNPVHHDFFDEAGGRRIYFEGTYTRTFSDAPVATPRYEYNQILYRLDLSDARLAPAREN